MITDIMEASMDEVKAQTMDYPSQLEEVKDHFAEKVIFQVRLGKSLHLVKAKM